MELLKLLTAKHAVPVLAVMSEVGILVTLLAGVPLLASLSNMRKAESALSVEADPIRHLAALNVAVSEDAERLTQRLRLANAEHDRLASMGERWWRVCAQSSTQEMRALLYRLGPERFIDRVLLAWSRAPEGLSDTRWQEIAGLPRHWTPPDFPIAASDVMARGIPKGPLLGSVLRAAEEAWITADFPDDKTEIDNILDAAIASAK
jgi:poly(A) polymerase